MLTFETKIHRLEWFAQAIFISVTPMLQNLRIGLRKRRNGKSDVPWSSVEAGWKLPKIKGENQAAFFSPSENWCLLAPSHLKPEEREFVVDSRASMHMISKKDLNSSEMDTLTKSCSPTIVITANGEVQTHEEATVYVKELEKFLTMKVFEDTPAVLSLGKLCDEHGCSCEWINGEKPHLIIRYSDTVRHGELRSNRGSWYVNEFFFQFSLFNIYDTFKAGDWTSYIFLKLVYFTNHNCVKRQWE